MDILSPTEIDQILGKSELLGKYGEEVDRESAYEILTGKIQAAQGSGGGASSSGKPEKSTLEKVLSSPITKQVTNTVMREVTRGLLGVLGLGGRRGKWF